MTDIDSIVKIELGISGNVKMMRADGRLIIVPLPVALAAPAMLNALKAAKMHLEAGNFEEDILTSINAALAAAEPEEGHD